MNKKASKDRMTLYVHGVKRPTEFPWKSVNVPACYTSTFAFENTNSLVDYLDGKRENFIYTRYSNPTVALVEEQMAEMENGERAILFSSGMAAISSTFLGLLNSGDEIISIRDVYGGTYHLFTSALPRWNIKVNFVSSLEDIEKIYNRRCKVFFFETPTNPLLRIYSIKDVVEIARKLGMITVMDNTFATPYNQNPLKWGVDIVVHSGTKYLGGHSDITCGAVIGPSSLLDSVYKMKKILGGSLDPHSGYLLYRGIKTLGVRMEVHNRNAMKIAKFLEQHPVVTRVYYPGLASHHGYEVACEQMSGFGGMVSFEVAGDASRVVDNLKIFVLAVSLGGVESLVSQPVYASHYGIPENELKEMGISKNLIRLSVGIEHPEDLINDLDQALRTLQA